jgi:MEMO1 family protein
MSHVRSPAVAGSFYPGNAVTLAKEIDAMLADAGRRNPPLATEPLPKALIVPHAGYVYSGPVAAAAYLRAIKGKGVISRVVLLGPVHRVSVSGVALSSASFFETPLGAIPLDVEAARMLTGAPGVILCDQAHELEHSLEVQLPFLQRTLGKFSLIPLAVGDAAPELVARLLELLWGGEETLVVISSDLSHYLPYDAARMMDAETVGLLLGLQLLTRHEQACGAIPVNGLIVTARKKGLVTRLMDLRSSGDTAGDKERVVGYAAIGFYQEAAHV